MIPTRYCDECEFHRYELVTVGKDLHEERLVCLKGHKPKFYLPSRIQVDDFGYKRRCGDFEPCVDQK